MYALLTGRGIALKDAARDCAIFHWGGRRSVCTLLMGSPAALSVAGATPEAAVCVSATTPSRSAALGDTGAGLAKGCRIRVLGERFGDGTPLSSVVVGSVFALHLLDLIPIRYRAQLVV